MAREGAPEDPAVPPDVGCPKKRLPCPRNAPDVVREGPDSDVGGPGGAWGGPDVTAQRWDPDVGRASNGHGALQVESDTDVEEEEEGPNPDVQPPKGLRATQKGPGTPDVAATIPKPDVSGRGLLLAESDTDAEEDPDVGPQTRLGATQNVPETPDVAGRALNPDVSGAQTRGGALQVESDTDVEEDRNPDVQPPKGLRATPNVPETPDVAGRTPNPDVWGPSRRPRLLLVESDTDVEGDEDDDDGPDVRPQKRLRRTRKGPETPDVAGKAPNPDVQGRGTLLVDSDTDVEEDDRNPDVRPQRRLKGTQNIPETPDVASRTPNPDVLGPSCRPRLLLVESDTDVEEDNRNPDVEPQRRLKGTQNVPETPDVAGKGRNPDVWGRGTLLVESDTDVEEEDNGNPDVWPPKRPRATQKVPETPDVAGRTPNPDVLGPSHRPRLLLVESDTDVEEEDDGNPDVRPPKRLRLAQEGPGIPDVEVEPPRPDVCAAAARRRALRADSDTDVEQEPDPDVEPRERRKGTQNVPETPDVAGEPPDPDVSGHGLLLVESDTDVGEGRDPDVRPPRRLRATPEAPETPDVGLETPNPDVGRPKVQMLLGGSDTDVEGAEENPDVRPPEGLRATQKVPETPDVAGRPPNPDVWGRGTLLVESDTDVEGEEADPDVCPPKRQETSPGVPSGPDVRPAPPNPDVESCREGPSAAGIPDVAEGEESDPDVATQLFLTPDPDVGIPERAPEDPGIPDVEGEEWDPDVSTQLFLPSPDVPGPRQPQRAPESPGIPAVRGESPDPDVEGEESDPDVATQLFLPSPDVGSPGTALEDPGIPDVEAGPPSPAPDVATQLFLAPDPDVGAPRGLKRPRAPPKIPAVEEEEEWNPDVATQLFLAPDPDVGGPKQLKVPPRIPDVEEEEEEEEGYNPDVATQLFLAPDPDVGAPKGLKRPRGPPEIPAVEEEEKEEEWDPDVATQLFLPLDPDVPGPRRAPEAPGVVPDVGAAPPDPDVGSPGPAPGSPPIPDVGQGSPAPDVGGGPAQQVRRSQRLAKHRGGVASVGPAPSLPSPDQGTKPRPSPKPRPQRRRDRAGAGLEEATPSVPIQGSGRGSAEATPPGEEPAEGPRRRLRPRAAPGHAHIRVLFTGLVASPALRVALDTLGATEATSVHDCSHLVSAGIRRTLKFLCALGRGVPIVTPEWLIQSSRGGRPLSPDPFLPRDPSCERRFGFRLRPALARARSHPLLQGYRVHVTPSVRPSPRELRDIVTCCGGGVLGRLPTGRAPRVLVVSCPQDRALWPRVAAAGLPLLSPELLLSGVLRQRLHLEPSLLTPSPDPGNTHPKNPAQKRQSPGAPPDPEQVQTPPKFRAPP